MDYYKLSKVHDMLALMLDLWFKDLKLVGNYVGQATLLLHMIQISSFKLLGYVPKVTIWMVEH
jgi:hypothetical protein